MKQDKAVSRKKNPLISIVIPLFNEQQNLPELYKRLNEVLTKEDLRREIIFVDDGSTDESFEVIHQLRSKDETVKAIRFSRNFGHQIAITAGIDYCKGDAVIMMDADLQHPPELISDFLVKWREGYEIISGIREQTEKISFFKRISAKCFYALLNRISDIRIAQNTADFRLLDRKVTEYIKKFPEKHRFIRGIIGWLGFSQTEIEYKAPERYLGKTKYTLKKMFRLAMDGVTSFSFFPLKLSILFGIFIALVSIGYMFWAIYMKVFVGATVPGWTSLMISVLFLGSIQLLCIGMIGLYVARIYDEVKQRPLYLIHSQMGLEDEWSLRECDPRTKNDT